MSVQQVNERLAALTAAGTSVWLDQIRRGMIESGELAADGRGGLAARRHLEPGDLREGDPRLARLRRGPRRGRPRGPERARGLPPAGGQGRAARRRRAAPRLRRRPAASTATCRWRSRRGSRTTPRARSSRRAMYWGLVDRPNLMIKIPATDAGHPGDRAGALRGHERQRHAAVRGLRLRAGDGGVHPRDGAPPRGGPAARPPLGRLVLRLARRHRGRQAARGARPHATCRAAPGWPTRAPPTRRSSACSRASASPTLRDAGCPVQRPLWASTGVKNPHYPETMYVYGLVGPHTVNTMPLPTLLAAARDGEVTGATRGRGPDAPTSTRCARPASTSTTSPTSCCATASTRSWCRWPSCSTASSASARRSSPAARARSTPTCRPSSSSPSPSALKRAADEDVVAPHLGAATARCGRPTGTPEVDRPARLADIADEDARGRSTTLEALRRARCAPRATPTRCCSAWAARASRPRSSAARSAAERRAAPARARLHPPGPGRRPSPTPIDLDKTLFIVSSKSGGTIEPMSLFKYFHALPAATAAHFVAVTDPGTGAARARPSEHGFRRVFHDDPDIGGRYCALSHFGLVPAALAGVDVGAVLEGARGRRRRTAELRRRATPGLWLGARARRAGARGPRQAHVRRRRRRSRRSASGPSSSSPSRPASRAAASCRSPTSRWSTPGAYGADRVFLHLATPTRPTPRHAEAMRGARRGRPPGDHDHARTAPSDLGRIFFLVRVRHRGGRLGAGDQPVRPAQRAGGQGQHQRACSSEGAPRARGRRRSTSCSTASRRPRYLAIMGYLPYSDDDRGGDRARCARALIERHGVATTWGYGPRFLHSTGQFHKGGPPVGALPAARRTTPTTDLEIPGRAVHVPHADPRAGRRRPADAARPRPAGRARAPPAATSPAPSTRSRSALDADRLRRPRQDGRQHGPSHPARLGPRGRRLRLQRRRPSAPPRATARPARRSLEDLVSKLERAAHGLDDGPVGRPDRADGRRARRAARAGRHDRRRRQHQLARRRAPRRRARPSRASTTSTSAPPAASGASRSATA